MNRRVSELIALWCFILALSSTINAMGFFEVKLLRVENKDGKLANGRCCYGGQSSNDSVSCPGICRTIFRVCLLPYRENDDESMIREKPNCSYGEAVSPYLDTNSFNVENIDESNLSIPFTFTWPGSTTVVVQLLHQRRTGEEELIQTSIRSIKLNSASPGYLEIDSNSRKNTSVRFRYRIKIHCALHYYGPLCNVGCKPEDNTFGHYECNDDGSKRCKPGWRNEATRCIEPICADGCQGGCDRPGECSKCPYGWTGPNCDQCIKYPGCVNGGCTLPFECNCDPRWGGRQCDVDMDYCYHKGPCRNGATCRPSAPNNYTCDCRPGFTGRDCEIEENPCASSPCLNFGTCVVKSKLEYQCVCSRFHAGDRCERLLAGRGEMDPCLFEEQYYEHGQSWELPGCRRCQCFDGTSNCTKISCQTGDCFLPGNSCPDGYHCSPTSPDIYSCLRPPCSARNYGTCLPNDFDESLVQSKRRHCNQDPSLHCSHLILNMNISALPIGTYASQVCYHLLVHVFERRFFQYHIDCSKAPHSSSSIRIQIIPLNEQWPAHDFGKVLANTFNENHEAFNSAILRAITGIADDIEPIDNTETAPSIWTDTGSQVIIASIVVVVALMCLLLVVALILHRRLRGSEFRKPMADTKILESSNPGFKLNNWEDQRKQCNLWPVVCKNEMIKKERNDTKVYSWSSIKDKKQRTSELVIDTVGRSGRQHIFEKENGSNLSAPGNKDVKVRLKDQPMECIEVSV